MRVKAILIASILFFLTLSLSATVEFLSLAEQVQAAKLIIYGEVLSSECHTEGKANFIYTDYTVRIIESLYGNYKTDTIILSLAGGRIGDKCMSASDVPALQVGEKSIFMLVDTDNKTLSPLVGSYQGRYIEELNSSGTARIIKDSNYRAMKDENGSEILFETFKSDLVRNISAYKALPEKNRQLKPESVKYLIMDKSELRYVGGAKTIAPFLAPPLEAQNPNPAPSAPAGSAIINQPAQSIPGTTPIENEIRYQVPHCWTSAPTTMEPVPNSYSWANHDQYMMAVWNKYLRIFTVSAPTGNYGYPNFINEMCGYVSEANLQSIYGRGWGTAAAVCFTWWVWPTSYLAEADICMNPSLNWTLNSYATYLDNNLFSIDTVLLHELGHAWGANHEFNTMSVMNYAPKKYFAYTALNTDDANGLRNEYSGDISRKSIGICGYKDTGYQSYTDAQFTSNSIIAGTSMTLTNFTVENPGTMSANAVIDFFLTPVIMSWDGAIHLGTYDMGGYGGGSRNYISSYNIGVPSSTPLGDYYLAMSVVTPGDEIPNDNVSWVDNQIHIIGVIPSGVWTGTYSFNWDHYQNWQDGRVPTAESNVLIPAGCTRYPNNTTNVADCHDLTVEYGASIGITANYFLNVMGDFNCAGSMTINGGGDFRVFGNTTWQNGSILTYDSSASIWIYGNWTVNQLANVQLGYGTINFQGSNNSNIIIHGTTNRFNNVSINKSDGAAVIFSNASTENLRVTGNITVQNGSYFYLNSEKYINLFGDLDCYANSYIIGNQGRIVMSGSNQDINIQSAESYLCGLTIAGSNTVTMLSNLTLNGDIYFSTQALNTNFFTLTVKGNWTNYYGTTAFNEGSGTVVFAGDRNQYVTNETFYNLTLNKTNSQLIISAGVTVSCTQYTWISGELNIAGTFNANDLTNPGIAGRYFVYNGTVNLSQDGSQPIDLLGHISLYEGNFNIYGGNGIAWFPFYQDASLTLAAGTLDFKNQGLNINASANIATNINGGLIKVNGSLNVNNSQFVQNNGEIELYGANECHIQMTSETGIKNLVINKTSLTPVICDTDIKVNGDFTISYGSFLAPSGNFSIGGNWINNIGPDAFQDNFGTVVFTGSSHQYSTNEIFSHLTIAKTGGAFRPWNSYVACDYYNYVSGAVDVFNGTFSAYHLTQPGIYGDFYANLFSTIDLYQNNLDPVDLNGNLFIFGGIINVHGGGMTSALGMAAPASLNMSSGELNFLDQGIQIGATTFACTITGGILRTAGSFIDYSGTFNPSGLYLEFIGGAEALFSLTTGSYLNTVTINKSGGSSVGIRQNSQKVDNQNQRTNNVTAYGNMRFTGDFILSNGIFSAPDNLILEGNLNVGSSASFIPNNGTVVFAGSNQNAFSGNATFYNLSLNKSGEEKYVVLNGTKHWEVNGNLVCYYGSFHVIEQASMVVAGNVVLPAGGGLMLDGAEAVLSYGGNLTDYNTSSSSFIGFNMASGIVNINGEGDQRFATSQPVLAFPGLYINKSAGSFIPVNHMTVNGDFSLNGNFGLEVTGRNHSFYGNFFVSDASNWYDHTCQLIFAGTTDQNLQIQAPLTNVWFKNMMVNKTGANPLLLLSDIRLLNSPFLRIYAGTFNLNGYDVETNGDVLVESNAIMTIPEGSALKVDGSVDVNTGGVINFTGVSGNPAIMTHYTTPNYGFMVDSAARISAEYAVFEYMNTNGIYVTTTGLVDTYHSFNNCEFRNGASGGCLLKVENSQDLMPDMVNFPANTWGGTYNVSKTSDTGSLVFMTPVGDFAGAAYESDVYNRISWVMSGQPDLTVDAVIISNVTPYIGDLIDVSVRIINSGTANVAQSFYLDFFSNLDTPPVLGQYGTYYATIPGLAAGDTVSYLFSGITYNGDSTWNMYAVLDTDGQITESNEGNNISVAYNVNWQELPIVLNPQIFYNSVSDMMHIQWDEYPLTVNRFNLYGSNFADGSESQFIASTTGTPEFDLAITDAYKFYFIRAERDIPAAKRAMPARGTQTTK